MGNLKRKHKLFYYLAVLLITYSLQLIALPALAADFSVHGYYRARGEAMQNLDTQSKNTAIAHNNDRIGLVSFNQMRFRLEPIIKVNDNISLHSQFDILDNVVFGSEETKQLEILSPVVGTVTLPAGPGSISMVGGEAGENKAINVRRAWMDVLLPIGKLRVGRMATHWGLGIFQNDGNDRQGDFGDSADGVMFMSQYDFSDGGSVTGGIVWDIAYEAQHDPRIGGLATAIRDNGQDTNQFAAIALYDRPEFSIGVLGGVRRRDAGAGATTTVHNPFLYDVATGQDGDTMVYFGDVYGRYTYEEYDFRAEYVFIGGKMSTGAALDAIPFSVYATNDVTVQQTTTNGVISLKPEQDVQVSMAALEASGAYKWGGEWTAKGGFAQGDASPLSQRITQYGFRPDYNIALLMFNVPLGTSPALTGTNASGVANQPLAGNVPITGNFVNNTYYVSAGYQHHFDMSDSIKNCNDFSIGGRATTAWAHKNAVDLNFQALLGDNTLPILRNSSKWYGVEADIVMEAEFYDHLYAVLEGGFLMPGGAYDVKVDTQVLGTMVDVIPVDKAEYAYGGRLTLMVEF